MYALNQSPVQCSLQKIAELYSRTCFKMCFVYCPNSKLCKDSGGFGKTVECISSSCTTRYWYYLFHVEACRCTAQPVYLLKRCHTKDNLIYGIVHLCKRFEFSSPLASLLPILNQIGGELQNFKMVAKILPFVFRFEFSLFLISPIPILNQIGIELKNLKKAADIYNLTSDSSLVTF